MVASKDRSAEVRQAAAEAVGFGQIGSMAPRLGELLKDKSLPVRNAAAMSLLSLHISLSHDVLVANIKDPEYRSLFVNALAMQEPEKYIADLTDVIVNGLVPEHFWGGRTPAFDSWNILFKYVQTREKDELASGKLNAAMDTLEGLKGYSSSEPRDLYALYLQMGLVDRAKAFREKVRKEAKFDMDYYFNMVDASPYSYNRE